MEKKELKILVKNFEIKEISPCYTTPGYIRFIAQADNEIGDAIPWVFLNLPIGKTNYILKKNTLTFRLLNRNVTLFPSGKIGVTNTKDREEMHEITKAIKKIINEAYTDFLRNGKANLKEIEAIKKISWMELYKFLPHTNCGKCGFPICSSFAVSVLQGDSSLSQCELLKEAKYSSNIKKLKEKYGQLLISSLGWK